MTSKAKYEYDTIQALLAHETWTVLSLDGPRISFLSSPFGISSLCKTFIRKEGDMDTYLHDNRLKSRIHICYLSVSFI